MHNLSYAFRICLRITVLFTFFIFWGIFCLIPDGKKTFRNVCIGIFHNSSFVYMRWQKTTYLIRHWIYKSRLCAFVVVCCCGYICWLCWHSPLCIWTVSLTDHSADVRSVATGHINTYDSSTRKKSMVSELVFFFCLYINTYKKKNNYRLQYVGYISIV